MFNSTFWFSKNGRKIVDPSPMMSVIFRIMDDPEFKCEDFNKKGISNWSTKLRALNTIFEKTLLTLGIGLMRSQIISFLS
jgi:hypothetical protein